MTQIPQTQQSLSLPSFGKVFHASVAAFDATSFKDALPHLPLLAEKFGKQFPRMPYNADRLALNRWRLNFRNTAQPVLSASLDRLSEAIVAREENRKDPLSLFTYWNIDPSDIMLAGYFELVSPQSYDRFMTVARTALPMLLHVFEQAHSTDADDYWPVVEQGDSVTNEVPWSMMEDPDAINPLDDDMPREQWTISGLHRAIETRSPWRHCTESISSNEEGEHRYNRLLIKIMGMNLTTNVKTNAYQLMRKHTLPLQAFLANITPREQLRIMKMIIEEARSHEPGLFSYRMGAYAEVLQEIESSTMREEV